MWPGSTPDSYILEIIVKSTFESLLDAQLFSCSPGDSSYLKMCLSTPLTNPQVVESADTMMSFVVLGQRSGGTVLTGPGDAPVLP